MKNVIERFEAARPLKKDAGGRWYFEHGGRVWYFDAGRAGYHAARSFRRRWARDYVKSGGV